MPECLSLVLCYYKSSFTWLVPVLLTVWQSLLVQLASEFPKRMCTKKLLLTTSSLYSGTIIWALFYLSPCGCLHPRSPSHSLIFTFRGPPGTPKLAINNSSLVKRIKECTDVWSSINWISESLSYHRSSPTPPLSFYVSQGVDRVLGKSHAVSAFSQQSRPPFSRNGTMVLLHSCRISERNIPPSAYCAICVTPVCTIL